MNSQYIVQRLADYFAFMVETGRLEYDVKVDWKSQICDSHVCPYDSIDVPLPEFRVNDEKKVVYVKATMSEWRSMTEPENDRVEEALLAGDVMLGAALFSGRKRNEYISTYCYRKGYWKRVALIDAFFLIFTWKSGHCQRSYEGQKQELGL